MSGRDKPLPDPEQYLAREVDGTLKAMNHVPTKAGCKAEVTTAL